MWQTVTGRGSATVRHNQPAPTVRRVVDISIPYVILVILKVTAAPAADLLQKLQQRSGSACREEGGQQPGPGSLVDCWSGWDSGPEPLLSHPTVGMKKIGSHTLPAVLVITCSVWWHVRRHETGRGSGMVSAVAVTRCSNYVQLHSQPITFTSPHYRHNH